MVSGPVTDPELLRQLESDGGDSSSGPVTDPALLAQLESNNPSDPVQSPQGSSWKQKVSDYLVHPLIEGGSMAVGGAAGAVIGSPAGPIGAGLGGAALATAMYPPAKRAAEDVDRMMGLTPPPQPSIGEELQKGAEIETAGRVMNVAAPAVGRLFRSGAKKVAKLGQGITGARSNDIMTAYDKGLSVYGGPGLKKAGKIFDDAAIKSGAKVEPGIEELLDPQLQHAKDVALTVANKMRGGEQLSAQEALSGRQALDFIKEATPFWQAKKLRGLSGLRDEFAQAVEQASPGLKDASTIYRNAKVRSTLLKPMRINKRGDYSALLPMMGTIGSAVTRSPEELAATGGAILATSPLAAGAGAALSGEAARATTKLMASPVASRAIASKVLDSSKAREYLKKANGDKDLARKMAKADGWQF